MLVEQLVQPSDDDSQHVYFLAFKLHCLKGEIEDAIDMFRTLQEGQDQGQVIEVDLLLEIFNTITSCQESPNKEF